MRPLGGEKLLNVSIERYHNLLAFLAYIAAGDLRLHLGIAFVAQGAVLVLDEPAVGQLLGAQLAAEALRMPAGGHGLDDPSDDELTALIAAGCEKHLKVAFAVLASLELVEYAILERSEALSTSGK